MSILSMNPVVNVSVNVLSSATSRANLTLGCFITADTTLANDKFEIYDGLEAVADDYASTADEYKAAVVYFGQNPAPSQLMIYSSKVTITSSNVADVIAAARNANSDWFACYIINGNTDAIITAAAAAVEALAQKTMLFVETDSANVKNNTSGNLFANLAGSSYDNTFGVFSDVPFAAVSAMAFSMANNSLIPGSFYTMDAKSLPGITPSDLTEAQANNIKGNNGNVYINRMGYYMLESGTVFSGKYYDEVVGIYALTDEIQRTCLDLLTSTSKIPQTDLGVSQIVNVINASCSKYVDTGFIAPGVWNGGTVYNLNNGDTLTNGYLVQAQPISSMTAADREARKSPIIYVCVKLAGAVQSIIIRLNINR